MDHPEATPRPVKPRLQEYEDPHYHDDYDVGPMTEDWERRAAQPEQRKPARRIPPPPRRYAED